MTKIFATENTDNIKEHTELNNITLPGIFSALNPKPLLEGAYYIRILRKWEKRLKNGEFYKSFCIFF